VNVVQMKCICIVNLLYISNGNVWMLSRSIVYRNWVKTAITVTCINKVSTHCCHGHLYEQNEPRTNLNKDCYCCDLYKQTQPRLVPRSNKLCLYKWPLQQPLFSLLMQVGILEAFAPFEKCESVIYIVFKVLRVEIRSIIIR
jgi:hypothetical protein